ncbi:hypothetical protein K4A83_06535 [Spirulina subsalsa FACHB-351]|uniref:Uncharacterized protein n=1 Tax=Spirulina subsalsa FACHB-351 TaxID=234711 RepID=A0ABT3L347_9CYAN|nr:hypothetical protein [Spirulina subsalsa]MCW6035929.1 hypothetical protein [Spirulina subsalsa FACHB-351]
MITHSSSTQRIETPVIRCLKWFLRFSRFYGQFITTPPHQRHWVGRS